LGLLLGSPIGDNAIIAITWSIGIALASYLWARKPLRRDPSRS
jgi:ABC-2 type transport system permease protein